MSLTNPTINHYLQILFNLHNRGIKLGLKNTQEFLDLLGNPQKKFKCIHVAGSNGKGSTSSFIASILTEAGYNTGLYTSPHFIRYNERIRINGQIIPDKYVIAFMEEFENLIYETNLTFFEVTTVLAFKYFADKEVDYAIIETGLGGRLDATNVITPLASVITSISLEHTNILGNSIEEIAKEKGGIIKPGVPLFLGKMPEQAEKTLIEMAAEKNCKYYKLNDYTNKRENYFEYYSSELYIDHLSAPLKGAYQQLNASLAILTLNKTLRFTDSKRILGGIKNVVHNTGIQGRYEKVHDHPKIILDSAHNIEGVQNFLKEFTKDKIKPKPCYLLFSCLNDKSLDQMLIQSKDHFDKIYLYELKDNDRAAKIEQLVEIAENNDIKYSVQNDIPAFIKKFIGSAEKECLVVYGSMYLVAEVKKVFEKKYYSNNL